MGELGASPQRDLILRDAAIDITREIISAVATGGEGLMAVIAEQGYAVTTLSLGAPGGEGRDVFKEVGLPEKIEFDVVFDTPPRPGAAAAYVPHKVTRIESIFPPHRATWQPAGPGHTLFFFVIPPGAQRLIDAGRGNRVWAKILALLDQNTSWVIHEVTHMLDNIRGGGFLNKAIGSSGAPRTPEAYYSSPWEFNAHFQEGMFLFRQHIEEMSEQKRKWLFESYRNFETEALKQRAPTPWKKDVTMRFFRNHLTPKMRRRFDVRLRQHYEMWKQAQDA